MKKLILLSSALLGVVFLAGCGQQQASQTRPKITAPAAEQPTVNQTADWKTYASDKYGFSFQYPSDWKLSENSGNNSDRSVATIVSPETQKLFQDKQVIYSEDISVYYYPSILDGDENAANKLGATTLEELIKKNTSITKIGSTEIGGKEATDVLWAGMGSYYAILATNNSHLYKIWFSNIDSKDNLTSIEKTILSTFKFTSATPADWKTYKNDKYEFEFQYPDDIKLEQPVSDVVVLKIGQNGGYLQIQNFVNQSSQPVSNYRPNGALPTKTVIIGSKTAQEYYTSSPQGEAVMVNLPYTDLVINFSDKSYIEIQYFASDSDKIIINQILSTLKFTK